FHRAIAQSGAAHNVHAPETAEWVTSRLLAALGLTAQGFDALLEIPVEDLLRAQAEVEAEVQKGPASDDGPRPGGLPFQPVVDGTVLPRPPLEAVAAGSAAGVPLVTGTTADEWNLFHLQQRLAGPLTEERARRRIARVVGQDRAADVVDAYRRAVPEADPDGVVCAFMTDLVFRQPAIRLAEAQSAHAPVSMYRFDLASTAMGGALGACHAIDVPFVFDNLDRGGVELLLGGLDEGARTLATRTADAWVQTARTAAPAHDDLEWPAYDTADRLTCVLDRAPRVEADPEA